MCGESACCMWAAPPAEEEVVPEHCEPKTSACTLTPTQPSRGLILAVPGFCKKADPTETGACTYVAEAAKAEAAATAAQGKLCVSKIGDATCTDGIAVRAASTAPCLLPRASTSYGSLALFFPFPLTFGIPLYSSISPSRPLSHL